MPEQHIKIASPDEVAKSLAEIFRGDVETSPDGYLISARNLLERRFELTNSLVSEINRSLQEKKQDEDTILWDARSYEALIREESRFGPPLVLRDQGRIRKDDPDTGLTYTVGTPSAEYTVFMLNQLAGTGALRRLRMPITNFRLARQAEQSEGNIEPITFFPQLFPRLMTVRVESVRPKTLSELAQLSAGALFQLTFNLDIPLVETRSWDDLLRVTRIRSRRSTPQEIEPPRRLYVRDLIYHYQMGVAADSPALAFLSYYHIAEHFFEQVFNDDLISGVREQLTQPGFSFRRKKDIEALIRGIQKRQRVKGESTVFSELEALRLTLQRFVSPSALLSRIQHYEGSLINHYATSTVTFCGGDPVDFAGSDDSAKLDVLAKRLYKTRNAVVHSKDGDKSKYVPFEHDRVLSKEIPLTRFIAEDIIVASSTVMQ